MPRRSLRKGEDSCKEEGSEDETVGGEHPAPAREDKEPNFWSLSDDCVILHHRNARTKLYVPDDAIFLIPLKYIDALLRTTGVIKSLMAFFECF